MAFILALLTAIALKSQTIGTFVSIFPQGQMEQMVLPGSHAWQMIIQAGDSLTDGGILPGSNDFTGYVPINGSSTHGFLSINSESFPGGVTILEIAYNGLSERWEVLHGNRVDFSALGDSSVSGTVRNCSGAVTPWGTIITCEEQENFTDLNGDGYFDWGWAIEVDPATHSVVDHDQDGTPDKLWALGCFRHENAVVADDAVTVYQGEESVAHGFLFKFVARHPARLDSGDLFVLQLNGTTGTWIQVPNSTQAERNRTSHLADSLGGTDFHRIEDVEIAPNGKVYFASTMDNRIYRFRDNGPSVSHFEEFADFGVMAIAHRDGVAHVQFATPDNLVFDGEGNLWVAQDGWGNHLWVFGPHHTVLQPDVRIFSTAVRGSEPTGMTFTPDFRFLFMSFQHPFYSNSIPSVDATGAAYVFNRASSFVFALEENLCTPHFVTETESVQAQDMVVFPNPAQDRLRVEWPLEVIGVAALKVVDEVGRTMHSRRLNQGERSVRIDISTLPAGCYFLQISGSDQVMHQRFVKQ